MTNERARANDTGLKPRTAPGGAYTFYSEDDADLSTAEGRIEWFCAQFDVEPPKLEYDEDEPDSMLATDELLEWCAIEGVILDWLVSGTIGGPLAVYREKYRTDPKAYELIQRVRRLPEETRERFTEAFKRATDPGADFEAIMGDFMRQEGFRATKDA